MKFNDNILTEAHRIALYTNMRYKHSALLLNKKLNIISTGYNYRTIKNKYNYSIHAEEQCLSNMLNKQKYNNRKKMNKYILLIIRIDKDNNFAYSYPCDNCLNIIKKFGIKKIYYSINNNQFIRLRL